MQDEALLSSFEGEVTTIQERVVVAPATGRFRPLPPEVFTTEGEWVEAGTVVAEVLAGQEAIPVHCPFRGWVMGMRSFPGHTVRKGDGLFWIRSA